MGLLLFKLLNKNVGVNQYVFEQCYVSVQQHLITYLPIQSLLNVKINNV